MFGLTQETFFALIVGAVLLTQFLFRQLRRKSEERRPEAPPETDAQATPTPAPLLANHAEIPAISAHADKAFDEWGAAPSPVAPKVSRFALPHPRRFSRQGLMPDRRAVQDAIVISTLLQPCRAHKPHDIE